MALVMYVPFNNCMKVVASNILPVDKMIYFNSGAATRVDEWYVDKRSTVIMLCDFSVVYPEPLKCEFECIYYIHTFTCVSLLYVSRVCN